MPAAQQSLSLTRLLAASRQEVFDAWTTPESMQQWMCPDGVNVVLAELDVRVGGMFRIDMLHDEERLVHTGVYREIVPPAKLVFTWASPRTYGRETLVSVELQARGDHTELTLTHTLLPDADAVQNHTRGWSQILECLNRYVQFGLRDDRLDTSVQA
jgi:uncharacterized protein YndB with AHSA1/START domain